MAAAQHGLDISGGAWNSRCVSSGVVLIIAIIKISCCCYGAVSSQHEEWGLLCSTNGYSCQFLFWIHMCGCVVSGGIPAIDRAAVRDCNLS